MSALTHHWIVTVYSAGPTGPATLTALPSIDKEQWIPMVQETDVLLVGGGDPLFLCYGTR